MQNAKVKIISQKLKAIFITSIALAFVGALMWFAFSNKLEVKADDSENVSGFAWSDLVGWVSFNNSSGGGPNDYGVNIIDNGATGVFSGHAWVSNAGWIDFDEANLVGCPSGTCRAWVDKVSGLVYGWGKFLTTNDWLKLRGTNYGVSISKVIGTEGDFSGYAWGGETGGWVSFNCVNKGVCSPANYKVKTTFDMNIKPTATAGLATSDSLCSIPVYNFPWTFNDLDVGDTQAKYQLQVDFDGNWNNNTTVPGEIDTGIVTSGALAKQVFLAKVPLAGSNQLAYGKTYNWRIKVWDNHPISVNSESAWAYGTNFTTPTHIYPTPYFAWSPKTIIKDQLIEFLSDASECYDTCNFIWTIPSGAEFASSTNTNTHNPVIKFNDSGNPSVSLQITDSVGACSTSTNVRVTLPLPKWKEILPQ